MSKEMEKLEGTVTRIIYVESGVMSGITARRVAKELIALIGKAYADGELKLPGEVGRINVPADNKSMPGFAPCFDKDFSGVLIALRKEEPE